MGVKGDHGYPDTTGAPGFPGKKRKRRKGIDGEPGNPGVDGVKGEKGDLGQKGPESKGCTRRALSVYVSPRGTLTVVENSPVLFLHTLFIFTLYRAPVDTSPVTEGFTLLNIDN